MPFSCLCTRIPVSLSDTAINLSTLLILSNHISFLSRTKGSDAALAFFVVLVCVAWDEHQCRLCIPRTILVTVHSSQVTLGISIRLRSSPDLRRSRCRVSSANQTHSSRLGVRPNIDPDPTRFCSRAALGHLPDNIVLGLFSPTQLPLLACAVDWTVMKDRQISYIVALSSSSIVDVMALRRSFH